MSGAVYELRDADEARRHICQGLWLARSAPRTTASVAEALSWSLEIASAGWPLPPSGLVADFGAIALGKAPEPSEPHPHPPGVDSSRLRLYEDHLLGRLYADSSFERAGAALARYQGRDRARAMAFLIQQLRERAGLGGAMINPAILRPMAERSAAEALQEGWRLLDEHGLAPELAEDFEAWTEAARSLADALGPEDVFELEQGTALAPLGQRLALRQTVAAAAELSHSLPPRRVRAKSRSHQVATRLLDEDAYPVGGFASLSNRGSVESLLHSQLAYMESDERPDLFDIKFLRDELLYYSRDENQFLRRRQTFLFALHPDLAGARHKDADLPWQRIIATLGLLAALQQKLSQWLSDESLRFEWLFLERSDLPRLDDERKLLSTLLRDPIAAGAAQLASCPPSHLLPRAIQHGRRSLCSLIVASTRKRPVQVDQPPAGRGPLPLISQIVVDGPRPTWSIAGGEFESSDEAPLDAWRLALARLLAGHV